MVITGIDLIPLRRTMDQAGTTLGFDSSSIENKNASAETLAAQRYAPPETVFVRILTDNKFEGLTLFKTSFA